MKNKKVILWTSGIDMLLKGEGVVGGLTVQMMHWANVFLEQGWDVVSYSKSGSFNKHGVKFYHFPVTSRASLVLEVLLTIYYMFRIKPDLVIFRGASRSLYLLASLSSLLNIKFVFMGASDVNFIPGSEKIAGSFINQMLYQKGLAKVKNIVVQNNTQLELLLKNYQKHALVIPNIWYSQANAVCSSNTIIWVGNFRRLKRPVWFLNLAAKLPNYQFVMVGFPSEKPLYDRCFSLAQGLDNLRFLGPLSFQDSEALFAEAKLLVCTSEYEGFPNTFLQAWSRMLPIVSSVDPNDLLSKAGLGVYVDNEHELYEAVKYVFVDELFYEKTQMEIQEYFAEAHDAKSHYKRLLEYI